MRRPRALTTLMTALSLAVAVTGCGPGGGTTPETCPNVLPDTCPSPEPTFSGDAGAASIIQARCAPCHAPGGVEAVRPFQTYQQISDQRGPILLQVHACKMPPAGAEPLTDDEKLLLLGWLKCQAPNN